MNPTNADNFRVDLASLGEDEQLWLHLAGELPAEASRALEVRLAADTTLRQPLESLRDLEASLSDGLGDLTLSGDEQAASEAARRRLTGVMNKAILERSIRPATARPAGFSWRINKWVASGIAAAVAVV